MLIWWIKKFTLLDYPGRTSTIIFTVWCNLRCPFCHNSDFVLPDKIKEKTHDLIPEDAFFNFLDTRKWLLDWVVICGGEPTVHSDLQDFASKIKQKGFLVKLDTNGVNPWVLEEMIQNNLVDYVSMDIKHNLEKYQELIWNADFDINNYKRSVNILLNSDIEYEFRTTLIQWYHTKEDILSICQTIKWAENYYLQNYEPGDTLDPKFTWAKFSQEKLEEFRNLALDYVKNAKIRQ